VERPELRSIRLIILKQPDTRSISCHEVVCDVEEFVRFSVRPKHSLTVMWSDGPMYGPSNHPEPASTAQNAQNHPEQPRTHTEQPRTAENSPEPPRTT
jgi:hypothetical protein